MTQISIPTEVLEIINNTKEVSISFEPINFHDIVTSRFLAKLYRDMKVTIAEEIDEGFETDILDKYKSFYSELDAHVYTLRRTDSQFYHSQYNHKFVEAIQRFKPIYFKAIAHKLKDDRLNWSIFSKWLERNLAKFEVCIELQNDTFLSMFSA